MPIHDNFIHHNQRTGGFGYGVVIGDGAYALIDRNVFDYNRHAIASDGSDDSGYRADENLVLKNGGKHRKIRMSGLLSFLGACRGTRANISRQRSDACAC